MGRIRTLFLGLGVACAAGALSVAAEAPQPAAGVDEAHMARADDHPGEWAGPGRTFGEQRFSPLKQINSANIKDLGLAWYAELHSTRGVEGTPIEVDGVLYDTQPWNITTAYDAKTGKLLWSYDPKIPQRWARVACCDLDARGLAAWKGRIYIAALDGRVIALDAKTGKEVWSVNSFDDGTPWPMVITGAPRVFDGKVLIGNSGGEAGGRGYITAYDAETGKKAWRFYIVPGDPSKPMAANQARADKISAPTWGGEWWKSGGGGNDWDALTYDPKLKLVYFATGNAGPWVPKYRGGPGDSLFTSSIVAVHVETGEYAWHYQEVPGEQWDYDATAPLMTADLKIDGKVLIGNSGGEAGGRGYITAYDAETGKKAWRFYIVPGDPSKPMAPNQIKADKISAPTWGGEWWKSGGGGNDWDALAYDPKLKLVYFATGNAGPWVPKYRGGPGDSLFTSSIVAVHVETGEYAWHYQEVPGEQWDYDATAPLMTADLKIDGKVRQVLMHAPKDGVFYVLDRATGKVISAKTYVPVNWMSGFDKDWRPIINPEMRYGEKPVLVVPNASHNWQPMAFNPNTGLIYFPVSEGGRIVAVDPDFKMQNGGMSQLGTALSGYEDVRKQLTAQSRAMAKTYLIAYDPVAQKEVWRVPYKGGGNGGVLTTAGNLVFEGVNNAAFVAYDATTGAKVWEMPVQQVPIAGAMSYSVDGEQYIAVNAGFGGGLAHDGQMAANPGLVLYDYGRLLVFKLGGKATLPAFTPHVAVLSPPPNIPHSNGEMKAGFDLYNKNCAGCHGEDARGGVKDLRRMSAETHKDFFDIVLGGKRSNRGMASFADKLSHQDVELIQKYLIGRIEEDWTDLKNAG